MTGEDARAPGDLLREADRSAPGAGGIGAGGRPSGRARAPAAAGGGHAAQPRLRSPSTADSAAWPRQDPRKRRPGRGRGVRPRCWRRCRPLSRRRRDRLAALLADPSLAEPFESAGDVAGWLAGQPELTVGVALTDHRPRRGRAARPGRRRRGRPGRHRRPPNAARVGVDWSSPAAGRSWATSSSSCSSGSLRGAIHAPPATSSASLATCPQSRSTRRSPRTSSTPRCAARRWPSISSERLEIELPAGRCPGRRRSRRAPGGRRRRRARAAREGPGRGRRPQQAADARSSCR